MCDQYYAADAMALASSREEWADVMLESMACEALAVAIRVWHARGVVAPKAGILTAERTAECVDEGANRLRAKCPGRADTRRYAERLSWSDTTAGQIAVFKNILNRSEALANA